MKTRIFKIVLPLFAILLAISLSFATEAKRVIITGYYDHPTNGSTPVLVDCNDVSGSFCMYGPYQVFKYPNLTEPLHKNNQ
ncbi:hypothetical protein SAMN05428642_101362 [Flaviramulus basaltis]|uniref:Uncharacterized protein n=1 Tax=Flaviramulus basaltis TaxID=369401 RepID=A0A1K2IAU3_9FLAO|nr:DUF6520 family protein [Flaviramulus basaltis]SFZ89525.1 hypothetical protein SAMN05428642_101362 [Flaviramulus basaltis]